MKKNPRPARISRRHFLGQASCAAVGSSALFSMLLNMRMANTAAAQAAPDPFDPNDYKALVCLFLAGGNDSFNMLVPSGTDEYAQYAAIRKDLALSQASLLSLNPVVGIGRTLGLHPSMGGLASLFNSGKAAFIANVGTLIEPVTKSQYESKSVALPLGLYSHSDQIRQWQTSIPQGTGAVGWGGRTADLLHSLNTNQDISMSISLSGINTWQIGQNIVPYAITENGSIGLSGYEGTWGMNAIRGAAIDSALDLEYRDLFEKSLHNVNNHAIESHVQFSQAIENVADFSTQFPDTHLGEELHMVAKTIAAHGPLGMRRQSFFVQRGGWDHHDEVISSQQYMLGEVSEAVAAFHSAMEEIGLDDSVTLFSASDFGRTLTSNGEGSDHAWGGNHFMVGGAVNGARIAGHYPDLIEDGDLDTGRGRLIPTTSCDEYFAELALWFGVPPSDLDTVLPNINAFYNPGSTNSPLGLL
jgi:uncharacterized protein (DUF1501 family)